MSLTLKQQADHWMNGSSEAMKVMRDLIPSNRMYALFFGHLAIEKALKALCLVRQIDFPTFGAKGHDLTYIANLCGFPLTQEQAETLNKIKSFNIETRYDDYKNNFREICTPKYAAEWVGIITAWHKTLKKLVTEERKTLPNRQPMYTLRYK